MAKVYALDGQLAFKTLSWNIYVYSNLSYHFYNFPWLFRKTQEFQDFIRSKFGSVAYQIENERTDHSAKKASNAANKSSPPTKKARKEYNWSEAEDQIISKTAAQYRKDGVVGDPLWRTLAKQFGVSPLCVYKRWMNKLNPDLDRSGMTPQDDMHLWEGHCMFGNKWEQINKKYFESARWGEHLRQRWWVVI